MAPKASFTLDHVIPRSRGGNSTWENLVAAAIPAIATRATCLLNEIDDMILLREPRSFTSISVAR